MTTQITPITPPAACLRALVASVSLSSCIIIFAPVLSPAFGSGPLEVLCGATLYSYWGWKLISSVFSRNWSLLGRNIFGIVVLTISVGAVVANAFNIRFALMKPVYKAEIGWLGGTNSASRDREWGWNAAYGFDDAIYYLPARTEKETKTIDANCLTILKPLGDHFFHGTIYCGRP